MFDKYLRKFQTDRTSIGRDTDTLLFARAAANQNEASWLGINIKFEFSVVENLGILVGGSAGQAVVAESTFRRKE